MTQPQFDHTVADAQATPVAPVAPETFDVDAYAQYEASLASRCRQFREANSGVLVHRRMRVAEVFSHGCRDMQASLAWQLGALQKSLAYKADVPNFLEPWYGIGTAASAFGVDYVWPEGQAPAFKPQFASVAEALQYRPSAPAETAIGRRTLDMIEYFLEQTRGKLPMSLTDTQSPLNVACGIVDMNGFFVDMYDRPEQVRELLMRIAGLIGAFAERQKARIGEALVWPGHGFASARCFSGLGMSDDNALMISGRQYLELAAPAVELAARAWGGPVFHSCGNWADRIESVKRIPALRTVDAAFSAATDPSPNEPEPFAEAFAGTGIVVNARIVGGPELVVETVKRLWTAGMKLIVVTYCQSPEEQARVYDRVHEICA